MASKTLYITSLADEPFPGVTAVGTSDFVKALRDADSTKYVKFANAGSSFFSFELHGRVAYDNSISPVATISSIQLRVRGCQTKITPGSQPLRGILTMGNQVGSNLTLPLGTSVASDPPTEWEYLTCTSTADELSNPWLVGELTNGITLTIYAFGGGSGAAIYADQVELIINYTTPEPVPGIPVVLQTWMNHFEVKASVSLLNKGMITSSYPLTYYFEWVDQDPSATDPEIIYSSSPITITKGLSEFYSTIPDIFEFNEPKTYLTTNKDYWLRLSVIYAGVTYSSGWLQTRTLSADRISI